MKKKDTEYLLWTIIWSDRNQARQNKDHSISTVWVRYYSVENPLWSVSWMLIQYLFIKPGDNEIKVVRSHVYAKETNPDVGRQALVICNDGVDYGAHLIGRCLDWERSRRLRSTTHWLVWDVFSELNDWALILAKAAEELKHKVRFS
jgi:hypothetical protein